MERGQEILDQLNGLNESLAHVKKKANQFVADLTSLANAADAQNEIAKNLFAQLASKTEEGSFEFLIGGMQGLVTKYGSVQPNFVSYFKAYQAQLQTLSDEKKAKAKQIAVVHQTYDKKLKELKGSICTALNGYKENLDLQQGVLESQLAQIANQFQSSFKQGEKNGVGATESDSLGALTVMSDQVNANKTIIENRIQGLQGWIQSYNTVYPPAASNAALGNIAQNKAAQNDAAKQNAATETSPISDESIDVKIKNLEAPITRACNAFKDQIEEKSDVCELYRLELEARELLNLGGNIPEALAKVFLLVGNLQQYVTNTLALLNEQKEILQVTVESLLTEDQPEELVKRQEELDSVQARIKKLTAIQEKTADVYLDDALDTSLELRKKVYTQQLLVYKQRQEFIKGYLDAGEDAHAVGIDALNQAKEIDKTIQTLLQYNDSLIGGPLGDAYGEAIQNNLQKFTLWRDYFLKLAKKHAPTETQELTKAEESETNTASNAGAQNQNAGSVVQANSELVEDDEDDETMSPTDVTRFILYLALLVATMVTGAGAGFLLGASVGAAIVGLLIGGILAAIPILVMEIFINPKMVAVAETEILTTGANTAADVTSGASHQQVAGSAPVQQNNVPHETQPVLDTNPLDISNISSEGDDQVGFDFQQIDSTPPVDEAYQRTLLNSMTDF